DPHHLAVLARPGLVSAASRPPRHLPDQAALSFCRAAATARREGLPPPSTLSASRRTNASWRTKGGKVVTIPLAPRTARAIALAIGDRTGGPVFLATDGRRVDRH